MIDVGPTDGVLVGYNVGCCVGDVDGLSVDIVGELDGKSVGDLVGA